MAAERERKFLVGSVPGNLSKYPHRRIRQGYLVIDPAGPEARLRHVTRGRRHTYLLTVKHPTDDAGTRTEIEVRLSKSSFGKLWPLTTGQRLEKTRHEIPYQGLTIELDTYHGPLAGLRVAEVEFPSAGRSRAFVPPPWLGADVSHRKIYGNKSLARNGLPKRVDKAR